MDKLDYKKNFKALYQPDTKPTCIDVPSISYVCVNGSGDPNEEGGEYQKALHLLYGISYTIKMNKTLRAMIPNYFEYVVPPLEGFWWMDGHKVPDFKHKEQFSWIAMIRLPEFVDANIFEIACNEFERKHKDTDTKAAYVWNFREGLCVQIMHHGSYDLEPASVAKMHSYLQEQGYQLDFDGTLDGNHPRYHHEIYLSDPRKTKPEKLKTIIRLPIKRIS